MKKSRIKFIIYFFLLYALNLNAQTQLEKLWDMAEINNTDIKLSKIDYIKSEIDYKSRFIPYLPKLSLSSEVEYLDSESDLSKYPIDINPTVLLTWDTSLGMKIDSSFSYEMNRYVLNSLEEESIENSGYDQNPSLSISLSQALLPFWMQGCKKNPVFDSYKNNLLILTNSIEQTRINVKNSILDNYIQMRILSRNIKILENQIQLQSILVEITQKKVLEGTLTQLDLWNYESSLKDAQNNLNQTVLDLEQKRRSLEILCGNVDFLDNESILPSYENKLLEKDVYLELIELQRKELKNQMIITRQNYSPKLSLSGSYTYVVNTEGMNELKNAWNEKGKKKWYISCDISIAPENFSYIGNAKKTYLQDIKSIEEQELLYIKNKDENKYNYERMVSYYDNYLLQTEKKYEQQKIYYEVVEKQKKRGICTELDLLQAKLMLQNAENELKNCKDTLWYYKFLQYQYN